MLDSRDFVFTLVIIFLVLSCLAGLWVIHSHFEAKTYTTLTGVEVSTWQAMWVDLRVMEPAMERGK